MPNLRDKQVTWLNALCAHYGLTPTAIARKAQLASTMLTRFLNKSDSAAALKASTIEQIAAAFRIEPMQDPRRRNKDGIGPADATSLASANGAVKPSTRKLIDRLINGNNRLSSWLMQSEVMSEVSFDPGDILIIDMRADAEPGDIVRVRQIDRATGGEISLIRFYEPPFLLAGCSQAGFRKPIYLHDEDITVEGVVTHMVRAISAHA